MPRAVKIKLSHTPSQLRHLAASMKDTNQSRRLLSIAAVLDGMGRTGAAKISDMDRQTLRDWVHRFNAHGPAELRDNRRLGNPKRLSAAQQEELAVAVAARMVARRCASRLFSAPSHIRKGVAPKFTACAAGIRM